MQPNHVCASKAVVKINIGKTSVTIAAEQIDIPIDFGAESRIKMSAAGHVGFEQDAQLNFAIGRNSSKKGRLILDRVTDKINEIDAHETFRA